MTKRGDPFERILTALNEGVLSHDGWLRASALIDEACGIHGSALVHSTGTTRRELLFHLATISTRGEPREDLKRQYFDDYFFRDERIRHFGNLPDSRVVHITDMLAEEELKRSAVYNEFLLRIRKQNGLDVRLDGPDGSNILWCILDSVDSDGWRSDQLRLINALLPHIRQYAAAREAVANAGLLNASFADMLEQFGMGVIQIDAQGRVVMANDRARALLQKRDGLSDRGGILRTVWPGDDDRLQRLLAKAMPRLGGPAAGGSMTVQRPSQQKLMLHVHPVLDRQTGSVARGLAALVLIVDPSDQAGLAAAHVAAGLDLTHAEAEIAVLLAEGRTAREVAVDTAREYSTVRTHLKNIFSKLGISRQYELARLVLALSKLPTPTVRSD